jgi:hypothetical protein
MKEKEYGEWAEAQSCPEHIAIVLSSLYSLYADEGRKVVQ